MPTNRNPVLSIPFLVLSSPSLHCAALWTSQTPVVPWVRFRFVCMYELGCGGFIYRNIRCVATNAHKGKENFSSMNINVLVNLHGEVKLGEKVLSQSLKPKNFKKGVSIQNLVWAVCVPVCLCMRMTVCVCVRTISRLYLALCVQSTPYKCLCLCM